ncbi:hypothetical protein Ocin01_02841 [Orchesella cincta]|uniref:Uncharacterized protein n=1 Tax=Orchesella cincta TaxID=48709 RepID=A0A1D2NEZ5_ORCCI|nr:hypothetical protein Ocin01_02841 [Orchesella cincta]
MLTSTLVLIYLGVVGAAISDRQSRTVKQADKIALDSGRSLEFADALNSTNCGDLLVAKGGFITYKQSKNDERCIWTIRTHKWETKFLMHESTFVSESDHVLIYSVDENGDLQVKAKIDKETGREFVGVLGPLLFLSFTSTKGQEFLLEYFGFGYNEATGYTYGHAHLDNPSGNLVWPEKPVDYYQNTFSTLQCPQTLWIPDYN